MKTASATRLMMTVLLDIFRMAVASRLLRAVVFVNNGLGPFDLGSFDGYKETKDDHSLSVVITSFYPNDRQYQWYIREFREITTNDGRYGIIFRR